MKTKFIATVVAAVLVAGSASAQVVESFDLLQTNINENVAGKFSSIAVNIAEIDGSVDIITNGTGGGTGSVTDNVTDIVDVSLAGTDVLGIGAVSIDVDLNNSTSNLSTGTVNAVNNEFGDIATLAAGAVNTTDTDLTEVAGSFNTASNSAASTTNAASSLTSSIGSGVGVNSLALNTAAINGSVNVGVGGNNTFGGVSTTAAGAINTGNITAAFVGQNSNP